ncbi:MAG: class I SAM-dependent methyltransferase [Planctomycetota bacterium]|jgi:ubiquinone/menaquinone biosynthesis C-methylase UbiE
MLDDRTDRDWEEFGASDPYFYVYTHDKFQKKNLTAETVEEFFESGRVYIDDILQTVRQYIDPGFAPRVALDFGCGVGRMLIPLAEVAERVVGMDVSESMLNEAERNCRARSIENVSLLKSDDDLSLLAGKYDFIHSFIVFQHIPVGRGERIFERLLDHLDDGGVGVVHFTYAVNYKVNKLNTWVKRYIPLAGNVVNLIKGRRFFERQVKMYTHDLDRLFFLMQAKGVTSSYTRFTDHEGELGVLMFFQRKA